MKKQIFPPQHAEEETPPSSSHLFVLPNNPFPPHPGLAALHGQLPHPAWLLLDNEMLCAGFYVTQPGDRPGPR